MHNVEYLRENKPIPRDLAAHGIGWAVAKMNEGDCVRRRGWNGKNMHVAIQTPDGKSLMTEPYVYMRTANGGLIPWLCSQADLLAMDWEMAE